MNMLKILHQYSHSQLPGLVRKLYLEGGALDMPIVIVDYHDDFFFYSGVASRAASLSMETGKLERSYHRSGGICDWEVPNHPATILS